MHCLFFKGTNVCLRTSDDSIVDDGIGGALWAFSDDRLKLLPVMEAFFFIREMTPLVLGGWSLPQKLTEGNRMAASSRIDHWTAGRVTYQSWALEVFFSLIKNYFLHFLSS